MTTNNYTPGLSDPGPQGDDEKGYTGIVMNAIMLALGAMAMCAVMVTNVVNRRRHVVVTARTHDYAVAVMVAVAILVLLYMPVGAQDIGTCNSDSVWSCYPAQVYMPTVSGGMATVPITPVSISQFAPCFDWACISLSVTTNDAPCYIDSDGEVSCG